MNIIYSNRLDSRRGDEEHLSELVIEGNKIHLIRVKLINGSLRSRRKLEVTKAQALLLTKRYYIEQLIEYSERGLLRSPKYKMKLQALYMRAMDIEKVEA